MRKRLKRAVCVLMAVPFAAVLCLGLVSCKVEARSSYALDLEYVPAAGILYGEMTVTAVNTSETPQDKLNFALYPNIFREDAPVSPLPEAYRSAAYYDGESFGGIDVREISGGEGEVSENGEELTVTLPRALKQGESAELSMKFEVMLPRMNFLLGIGEHTVNLLHFYPALCAEAPAFTQFGGFPAERADYTVSLTVPASYDIICGFEGESNEQNGRTTFTMRAENVQNVSFVLAEGMTCSAGETAQYWHLRRDASEALAAAEGSLAFFSETFGQYSYPAFAVVETDLPFSFVGAGLALVPSSLAGEDLQEAVVRAIARQWWGEMAGSDHTLHPWQDEGLSAWSAALYFGNADEEAYRTRISAAEGRYRAFVSVREQLSGAVDTSMDRPLSGFSGAYEYRCIIEDKSLILFDRVLSVLGEKRMLSGLKRCFSAAKGRTAEPEELIEALSAGVDVSGIFTSFLEGTAVI